MKIAFKFMLPVLAFVAHGCCNGEALGYVNLTNEQKSVLPYTKDEVITMVNGSGNTLLLQTNTTSYFSGEEKDCQDYYFYEEYKVDLDDKLTGFNAKLIVSADHFGIENTPDMPYPSIMVNTDYLGEPVTMIGDLEIAGVTYTNVWLYIGNNANEIASVYYNTAFGIIKINYINGQYWQLGN